MCIRFVPVSVLGVGGLRRVVGPAAIGHASVPGAPRRRTDAVRPPLVRCLFLGAHDQGAWNERIMIRTRILPDRSIGDAYKAVCAWIAFVAASLASTASAQGGLNPELEIVTEGLTAPVSLVTPPGDDRRFVVEQTGLIWILDDDGTPFETPFLDVRDRLVQF